MSACERQQRRHQRLKAGGLCTYCGARRPVPGLTRCGRCREKERVRAAQDRTDQRNKPRTDGAYIYMW